MNQEDYEKTYPAREVPCAPEDFRYHTLSYWDAQDAKDKIEVIDECVCEVIKYQDTFYVVYKD